MFKQVQTKYFRSILIEFGSDALPVIMLLISIFENNNFTPHKDNKKGPRRY